MVVKDLRQDRLALVKKNLLIVLKKYCLSDLCFQVKEETYDPTPWGKIKNYIFGGALTFMIGMVTGVSI